MKTPSQMSKTATLVEGALMVALAYALSIIPFIELPWGGSITCFSTLPIVMMSLRHGGRWGVGTAFAYSLLQLVQGLGDVMAVPAKTLWALVLCALLDYILAYTCVGLAGPIANLIRKKSAGLVLGIAITGLLRLLLSTLSGIVLWGAYAWEGWPVGLYSLTYNAGWCLPDVAIVLVAALLLSRVKALGLLQTLPKQRNEI